MLIILFQSYRHIDIIGKERPKMPVIFTPEMVEAVNTLVNARDQANILPENPYLFPNSALGHLNTKDALKAAVQAIHAANPEALKHSELITSTKLRKYIATVSQVKNPFISKSSPKE